MTKKTITITVSEEIYEKLVEMQKKKEFPSVPYTTGNILKKHFENIESKKDMVIKPFERKSPHLAGKHIKDVMYKGKIYKFTEGKKCSKCGEWKPFSEFYKDSSKKKKDEKFGYMSHCKICKESK